MHGFSRVFDRQTGLADDFEPPQDRVNEPDPRHTSVLIDRQLVGPVVARGARRKDLAELIRNHLEAMCVRVHPGQTLGFPTA